MLSGFFNKQPNQSKQNWVSSKIVNAIKADDIDTLKLYLASNSKNAAALNASNLLGQTILMLTIHSRNTRLIIKTLAQPLVDVNAVARNGECPLTIAMSYNDSVTIEYLLDNKNLILERHGKALFIWAAECGNESIITRLAAHPWFIKFREENPKFNEQLLETTATKKQFNALRLLINLQLIDVNQAIAAINKHIADPATQQTLEDNQAFIKFVLCHPNTDFNWRELLAHNSDAYHLLAKLGAAEIRFVITHQDIRIIHAMFNVVNPEGFQAKSVYMDKLCMALANPDNRICNLDDLLKLLLQCPTFNRDMIIIENKSTNDLLREAQQIEQPPIAPPAREESSEDDESTDVYEEIIACRLI